MDYMIQMKIIYQLKCGKNSEGEEIKKIFNKIISQNLSKDAIDMLEIALLTNSNAPSKNITKKEFYNFQKNFLKKKRFKFNQIIS